MVQQTVEKAVQGGKHIGRVLKEDGVQYYFGVTGGHVFQIQVGLGMAGIKFLHVRHEQTGAYIADGYARASGKVGVCIGTAGPGMTNTISGIAHAWQCKSPVVGIYGQHPTWEDGRPAEHEAYAVQELTHFTKWSMRIISPYTIAYFTKKAVRDALTYPQMPVALEIPLDILNVRSTTAQQQGWVPNAYKDPAPPAADAASVEAAVKMLLAAQRPVIAGGEAVFWSNAEKELQEFVELINIPVITRRVGRGAVPENHPLAFSGRARAQILRAADVACTVGLNLGFLEGYGAWAAKAKLIQITEAKSDIETTAPSEMIIIASPKSALRQMINCAKDLIKTKPAREAWLKQVDEIKTTDRKRMEEDVEKNRQSVPIHPAVLARETCDFLDKDATIVLDGFSASHFITERFEAKHSGAVLDSGPWAGVGHGVGMGIGAQLAKPGKQVCVIMGDGGMGLGGFDVESAVRAKTPVCYILSNNSAWIAFTGPMFLKAVPVIGEPATYSPFFMAPTNYAQVFAAMGVYTERVERPEQIRPAMERAFNSGKASVIDVVVNPAIPPTMGRTTTIGDRVKSMLASYMDPEDFPDEIRKEYIDKKD
ncbi:MAG: thiamine pyrophosphate-binding protein [Chloroflexota bacterium]